MLDSLLASVMATMMVGGSVLLLVSALRPSKTRGHSIGDCTDEMFEAMREVDAMGLGGEPLLAARLPPREFNSLSEVLDAAAGKPPRRNDRMVKLPNGKTVPEEYLRDPDGQMVEREWEN